MVLVCVREVGLAEGNILSVGDVTVQQYLLEEGQISSMVTQVRAHRLTCLSLSLRVPSPPPHPMLWSLTQDAAVYSGQLFLGSLLSRISQSVFWPLPLTLPWERLVVRPWLSLSLEDLITGVQRFCW